MPAPAACSAVRAHKSTAPTSAVNSNAAMAWFSLTADVKHEQLEHAERNLPRQRRLPVDSLPST